MGLEQPEQRVFQRLDEWYLDAKHQSGKKRRELDVTSCFAARLMLDRAAVGKGEVAAGTGAGCDHSGGALDCAVDQCRSPQVRHPGGLERGGRVFCGASESGQEHITHAGGDRLRASLGRAHGWVAAIWPK